MSASSRPVALLVLTLLLSPLGGAAAAPAVEVFTLANGLRVVVVPRPGEAQIHAGWVVQVGSADERPGETGQAQLVAKLMEDGTRTIGTTDPQREHQLVVAAEAARARLRWAPDKTPLESELASLERELATIQDPGAFLAAYTRGGAGAPRSAVTEDYTVFTTRLPPAELETWFRLEGDRLREPVFRRIEERIAEARGTWETERTLNLAALAEQRFRMTAWDGHPYAWPTAGLPPDLARLTRRMLETFRAASYRPERITVVLVGPVEAAAAKTLAERHFGALHAPGKALAVRAKPFLHPGERSLQERVETVPRLVVEYRTPGAAEADSDVLELVAALLGGPQGRLQRALETAGQNASARARFEPRRQLGSLRLTLGARRSGPDGRSFLAPLDREIERLASEPVPVEELERARATLLVELEETLADGGKLARALLGDAGLGVPERTFELADRLARITPAELQRVVGLHLTRAVRTVGVFQPAP